MNDETNVNGESPDLSASGRSPGRAIGNGHVSASVPKEAPQFSAGDLLPFVNELVRRWKWLLIGGVAMAMVGLLGGVLLLKNSYTASAQLLRQASGHVTEVLGDRELDPNTYASLLRAPELVQRVAAQARPPLTPEWLAKRLNIIPERNSDVLLIAVSTGDQQGTVDLANLYAREAVGFMQELQTNAAARARIFLTQQLAPLEAEITALNKAPKPTAVRRAVLERSPLIDKLSAARLELADLLARYTEQHPLVREQKAKVAAIEGQLRPVGATLPTPTDPPDDGSDGSVMPEHDPIFLQTKLQSLENARLALLGQKQAAISLETQPPGTCRILAPATFKTALAHKRTAKVAVLTGFGGMLGFLIACAFVLLGEAVDPRLKTAADVQRVTRLPVVASAGNLARMTEAEQSNWAFRAWTSLQRLLSPSPNQGFVCGITSSESGEGRSTWIRLLAEEASQRGFRVLTIIARPPEHNGKAIGEHNGKAIAGQSAKAITDTVPAANDTSDLEALVTRNGNGALTATHVLNTPDEVTQKLIGPNPEPVVEIPLPGWVWNLERRKQWQAALRH